MLIQRIDNVKDTKASYVYCLGKNLFFNHAILPLGFIHVLNIADFQDHTEP